MIDVQDHWIALLAGSSLLADEELFSLQTHCINRNVVTNLSVDAVCWSEESSSSANSYFLSAKIRVGTNSLFHRSILRRSARSAAIVHVTKNESDAAHLPLPCSRGTRGVSPEHDKLLIVINQTHEEVSVLLTAIVQG